MTPREIVSKRRLPSSPSATDCLDGSIRED
jgi:hypothetical protein